MSRTTSADVFISVDIEADGPLPGTYSMLALGMVVAGRFDGRDFEAADLDAGGFYSELRPISDRFLPDAVAACGLDRDRLLAEAPLPAPVMEQARQWVLDAEGRDGKAIFVAFPAVFDWAFVHYYFTTYCPEGSPFGYGRAIDIRSLYLAKTRTRFHEAGRNRWPAKLRATRPHTHNAIDDAREQGELFANLFDWTPSDPS